jgi:hypothetical protein
MAGNQGTLAISDSQRPEIQKLQGRGAVHILCGVLGSLAHGPILGSQFASFLKGMQSEMPDVFHVFGDDPERHVRALVPNVLTVLEGGRYVVQKEGLKKLSERLKAESGWDLSETKPENWILAAVFVHYRGSVRPPSPKADPAYSACR